jgi:anaerobic magnesium-protoporphyrin IX monomethyl ester cyclase
VRVLRVLLIQPPVEDYYITRQRLQPTGLLYLASYLERMAGYKVSILDLCSGTGAVEVPLDPELSYLKEFYEPDLSPLRIFTQYTRFGASPERIRELVSAEQFDVCGISSNFTAYYKQALETARIVRTLRPDVPIVCGGNSIPVTWEAMLDSGAVDFTVFGEGEATLLQLLENLESPGCVPDIAYRKDGRPVRTEVRSNFDINASFLDLKFIDPETYKIGSRRTVSLITSRGCPMHCSYCTAGMNCLSDFRYKDMDLVFNEINKAVTEQDVGAVNIEDENFTSDKKYAEAFLERKIKEFPELRLYFMNGLHYPFLDDRLLELMRRADCKNLGLALVDTGDAGLVERHADMDKLRTVAVKALELGFLVTVYIIAGLPGQTAGSVKHMIDLIHDMGAVAGTSVYYPVPGTPLFDGLKIREPKTAEIKWTQMRSTALAYEQSGLCRSQLADLLRYARIRNLGMVEDTRQVRLSDMETEKDTLLVRSDQELSRNELKALIIRHFESTSEFLILKERNKTCDRFNDTFKRHASSLQV